jgi:PAS domain S-box-containing protein
MLTADEYRALVEHSPVMIWRSGLDAKCDYFNEVWLSFTGRTMEQELGDGWAEGVHPDDLQRCVDTYLDHFARRASFEMEYRLRRHDGVYRWIFDRGTPFDDDAGNFAGFIGSCVDVHLRREAEEARQGFLSQVAHELRAPLQAIHTYMEVILKRAAAGQELDADLSRKLFGQIERFSLLVDEIDGVRLVAQPADLALELGRLDLSQVVDAVWARWAPAGGSAKDEVHLASGHTLRRARAPRSLSLLGDARRLEQALHALLLNAVKFSPDGGDIEVRVEAGAGEQRVIVEDRGIGIPDVELDRVGQPFFRASNADNPRFVGMGLGLAIARTILHAHGGRLTLDRREDGGTSVAMVLPRAAA